MKVFEISKSQFYRRYPLTFSKLIQQNNAKRKMPNDMNVI